MLRKVYDEDLTAGGRLGIFLDSAEDLPTMLPLQASKSNPYSQWWASLS